MKRALITVVVAATSLVAWRYTHTDPADGGGKLVLDRLWIDHVPKHDRDPIKVFVALTDQPVGIFQTTSTWKGEYEVFQFEKVGGEFRAIYPQTGDREKFTAKGSACSEHGMDYCLEMTGASRGAMHYYSMKGWELDGTADVHATERAIEARLDALVPASTR